MKYNETTSVESITLNAWADKVVVQEMRKSRIYFQPGFVYEAEDWTIFVPSIYAEGHEGHECGIANTLIANETQNRFNSTNQIRNGSNHGGVVLVDERGRLYVDVVLHHLNLSGFDGFTSFTACLSKLSESRRRNLSSGTWVPKTDSWSFIASDKILVMSNVSTLSPPSPPPHHHQSVRGSFYVVLQWTVTIIVSVATLSSLFYTLAYCGSTASTEIKRVNNGNVPEARIVLEYKALPPL